jgi:hypothetical protein
MSEFRRPSGNQSENNWDMRTARLLFTSGINAIFAKNSDSVDIRVASNGMISETLTFKDEDKKASFVVARITNAALDRDTDQDTYYGVHIKENGEDYLYRVKSRIVYNISPIDDELQYLNIDIKDYAAGKVYDAGNVPVRLLEQPAPLKDVERIIERANKAKPHSSGGIHE